MASKKFKHKLQHIIPHHRLSRLVAGIANCKIPWIKNFLIKTFIQKYAVDLSSAERTEIKDYSSFNDFFTRSLKPSARPIVEGNLSIASPADGYVSQAGKISAGKLFQSKADQFLLENLIRQEAPQNSHYMNGEFMTLYLSPKDYHRVHMPLDGRLLRTTYVPGRLFSVNANSVDSINNLFCRNERLVCFFETDVGEMILILVGAMLVAGIRTAWDEQVTPCQSRGIVIRDYSQNNIKLLKGSEMGCFQFGSTVILLFGSNVKLLHFHEQQPIKMGECIGHIATKGANHGHCSQ